MTITTSNLGFPRLGRKREWKKAIESYWAERITLEELHEQLNALHKENLLLQKHYHLDSIPVGDFSLYDHVLDTSLLLFLNVAKGAQSIRIYSSTSHVVIKNTSQAL